MSIASATKQPLLSSNYFANLLDFVKSRGGSEVELLRRSQLNADSINDPQYKISFEQFRKFLLNGVAICDEPALGLYLGNQLSLTAHGLLGYAAMSSDDLKNALQLAIRYFQTRTPLATIDAKYMADAIIITITDCYPLGDIRSIFHEVVISALAAVVAFLTTESAPLTEAHFAFAAPDHKELYAAILGCPVFFDSPATQMVLPRDLLDKRLVLADKTANKIATQQCEEALTDLTQEQDIVLQIEQILMRYKGSNLQFETVANELNTSPRTLRRRLAKKGTSFQQILAAIRFQLAKQYLMSTSLSVHEISYLLGYSDPSNFGRAFRKWQGVSPDTYRKQIETCNI